MSGFFTSKFCPSLTHDFRMDMKADPEESKQQRARFSHSKTTTDFPAKYYTRPKQLASYSSHCLNFSAQNPVDQSATRSDDCGSAFRHPIVKPRQGRPPFSNFQLKSPGAPLNSRPSIDGISSSVEELTRINFPGTTVPRDTSDGPRKTATRTVKNNAARVIYARPEKHATESLKNCSDAVTVPKVVPRTATIRPETASKTVTSPSLIRSASHDFRPKFSVPGLNFVGNKANFAVSSSLDLRAEDENPENYAPVATMPSSKSMACLSSREGGGELDFTSTESVNLWCNRMMAELDAWAGSTAETRSVAAAARPSPRRRLVESSTTPTMASSGQPICRDSFYAACSALRRVGGASGGVGVINASTTKTLPHAISSTSSATLSATLSASSLSSVVGLEAASLSSSPPARPDDKVGRRRRSNRRSDFTWPLDGRENGGCEAAGGSCAQSVNDTSGEEDDEETFLASDCSSLNNCYDDAPMAKMKFCQKFSSGAKSFAEREKNELANFVSVEKPNFAKPSPANANVGGFLAKKIFENKQHQTNGLENKQKSSKEPAYRTVSTATRRVRQCNAEMADKIDGSIAEPENRQKAAKPSGGYCTKICTKIDGDPSSANNCFNSHNCDFGSGNANFKQNLTVADRRRIAGTVNDSTEPSTSRHAHPQQSSASSIRTVVAKIIKLAENELQTTKKKICADGLKFQKFAENKRKGESVHDRQIFADGSSSKMPPGIQRCTINADLVPENLLRCKYNKLQNEKNASVAHLHENPLEIHRHTSGLSKENYAPDSSAARDAGTQTSPRRSSRRFTVTTSYPSSTIDDDDVSSSTSSSAVDIRDACGQEGHDADVGGAVVTGTDASGSKSTSLAPAGRFVRRCSVPAPAAKSTVMTSSSIDTASTAVCWRSTSDKSLNGLLDSVGRRAEDASSGDAESNKGDGVEQKSGDEKSNTGSAELCSTLEIFSRPFHNSVVVPPFNDDVPSFQCAQRRPPANLKVNATRPDDLYSKITKLSGYCKESFSAPVVNIHRPSLNSPTSDRRFISKFIKDTLANQRTPTTVIGRKKPDDVIDGHASPHTIYDNWPGLRRPSADDDQSPSSPLTSSSVGCPATSSGDGGDFATSSLGGCGVDYGSPLLADSESSPTRDDDGNFYVEELSSRNIKPTGLTCSEAKMLKDATGVTQPAPEFQYKNPEDYERDRNMLLLLSNHSRVHADRACCNKNTSDRENHNFPPFQVPSTCQNHKIDRYSWDLTQNHANGGTVTACTAKPPCRVNRRVSHSPLQNRRTNQKSTTKKLRQFLPMPTLPSVSSSLAGSLPTLHRSSMDMDSYWPKNYVNFEDNKYGRGIDAKNGDFCTATSGRSRIMVENGNNERAVELVTAEKTARQCCRWLRAAGFPQYAKMYEDKQFPVDLRSVRSDHEFLDADSLQALFRRLHVLNECAKMDLMEAGRSKTPDDETDDEDADDPLPISRRWKFVRKSRTFSRVIDDYDYDNVANGCIPPGGPSSGPATRSAQSTHGKARERDETGDNPRVTNGSGARLDPSREQADPSRNRANLTTHPSSRSIKQTTLVGRAGYPDDNDGAASQRKVCFGCTEDPQRSALLDPPTLSPKLQRSHSERIKDKARAFVKRMDYFRNSVRHKSPSATRNHDRQTLLSYRNQSMPAESREINIGQPVLVDYSSCAVAEMHRQVDVHPTGGSAAAALFYCFDDASTNDGGGVVKPSNSMEAANRGKNRGSVAVSAEPPTSGRRSSTATVVDQSTRKQAPLCSPEDANSSSTSPVATQSVDWSAADPTGGVLRDVTNQNGDYEMLSKLKSTPPRISLNRSIPPTGLNVRVDRPLDESQSPSSLLDQSPSTVNDRRKVGRQRTAVPSTSSEDNDGGGFLYWERRDSGVGSSLSRSPSAPIKPRVRWHSFQRQHLPHQAAGNNQATAASFSAPYPPNWQPHQTQHSTELPLDSVTVTQFTNAQKFALLKLTALMEKFSPASKSSAGGWQFGVQKLLKKMKTGENKALNDSNQIFGVSLTTIAQRTGQPLPQCILHSMRFLRRQAADSVGIFRKSGVRSRIQNIRNSFESFAELIDFDPQQTYDVADTLKQYFRELPEPLLTSKLSETFVAIFLTVPEHLRIEAVQKAILLLPDENREAMQSVIYFLHDVASFSDTNQMTTQNLAVCFAPTLFQLSPRNMAMSPQRRHKTITGGIPNEKELGENRAAQMCLTTMIEEASKIFMVPKDIVTRCNLNLVEQHEEPASLDELGLPYGNYVTYLNGCIDILLKEHRERWRGWVIEGSYDGVEMSSKKVNDGHPLKLWRLWTDVDAPPKEVLFRVLKERESWDEDIVKWRVLRKISDSCDVFQYVCNDMPPHPTRDYCVLRKWLVDMFEIKGGCILVETSVAVPEAPRMGGVRGVCLASRYLVEPSGAGRSRIHHIVRIDAKGRSKLWYGKVFGHIWAGYISRIRSSFKQLSDGPETKV